ncbi:MAG: phenylalanine--tRNA ligase subunit alpha [Neisseriaceae bacterium]
MDKLTATLNESLNALNNALTLHDLDVIKSKYTGKAGSITLLMQELKNLPVEEKKEFGAKVNYIKNQFEEALLQKKELILQKELQEKLINETVDVTLNGRNNQLGSLHPVSITLNKMLNIFAGLGFDIADGPEIETDYYNFKALNIPDNHPARAMQDTFYTQHDNVLRTHTSPMQIRYTLKSTPPIKVVVPGRVYRVDMDATHSPMFHQLEGLWIDKGISLATLKGVIIQFLRSFFDKDDLKVRFRASFFPFTEPSAEVDILSDSGKWLEVMGCGVVHPKVLLNMNINPDEYSGFAFGMGIDRFTMLKYGIDDLRLMFENDMDFLKQFQGINEVSL